MNFYIPIMGDKYGNSRYLRYIIAGEWKSIDTIQVISPEEFRIKWPTVHPMYLHEIPSGTPGEISYRTWLQMLVQLGDPDAPRLLAEEEECWR